MKFDNSYARLPEKFFQRINPIKVKNPKLIRINVELAQKLGLELPENEDKLAEIFSGNSLLDGCEPIAQAYAGHQFGHFVPQLGDGRAILLGEVVIANNKRYDVQLKGSGKTRFSRGGDGRSPLGPVIREYIVSEAMHGLGIPTTRALAMVSSGEKVFREGELPGAIFTRIASSHIRVGTFEFFAARNDNDAVKILADYVIDRHYPQAKEAPNPYSALLEKVCEAHAMLVARWMRVGFIHGVMNTDNTTISGETIDYGPCAFMDNYDPATVFSSIDHYGRYAYGSQPKISQWNMSGFAGCLLPLIHDDQEQAKITAANIIQEFQKNFKEVYYSEMCKKIGIAEPTAKSIEMLSRILEMMHNEKSDFTNTFRSLCNAIEGNIVQFTNHFTATDSAENWLADWKELLKELQIPNSSTFEIMNTANPVFIPRNHRVEEAIRQGVEKNDFSYTDRLIKILAEPYKPQPALSEYTEPPESSEQVYQTFCGT